MRDLRGIAVQPVTHNSKLVRTREIPTPHLAIKTRFACVGAKVVSTYASITASCPPSCGFKDAGCYAQGGITGMTVRKIDKEAVAESLTADDIAYREAKTISELFKRVPQDGWRRRGRDLRLHISGDCSTTMGARMLDLGVGEYQRRGGGRAWTYTHSWRTIPREAWGRISVLASVENPDDALAAQALGYVPAIVVSRFPSKWYFYAAAVRARPSAAYIKPPAEPVMEQVKFIPCPAETRGTPCVECRLCMHDDKLRKAGVGIAFEAHGASKKKVSHGLYQLKF